MHPIAFTPGEPAGIGPDLAVLLAQETLDHIVIAYADPDLLKQRATQIHRSFTPHIIDEQMPQAPAPAGALYVKPVQLQTQATAGQLDAANSPYVLDTIKLAVEDCRAGLCTALVTGPVHKGVINDAGIPFTGHTEFLAELTSGTPVMMLACPGLRVALATTHLPLRNVPDSITRESLSEVLIILHHELQQKFGIQRPRILVCGLNPHAGESGYLGEEEISTITPVLDDLKSLENMDLVGPLPADTLFTPRYLENADAVLAMYHDQGLPVLKHMGFGHAVNITLGLPIIRTSVDHGTALELAGSGKAETGSLLAAIEQAENMAYTLKRK